MINDQDDQHKQITEYLKSQFNEINVKNSLEIKSSMNIIDNHISHYSYILNKYPVTVKSKDKFKDIHFEIQNKYWKKYKADLLQRTSWKANQNSQSVSELLPSQPKNLNIE